VENNKKEKTERERQKREFADEQVGGVLGPDRRSGAIR